MINNLLKNIMDEVEFNFAIDCNCDHYTICKYCRFKNSVRDILEVELNNNEEER